MHDPDKYKLFVIEQYKNIKDMIMRENRNEIKRYVRIQDLNVETCDALYIRSQILGALKMRKITKEETVNNIRQYFTLVQCKKDKNTEV